MFIHHNMNGLVLDRKRALKSLLLTALFNTIIAFFLTNLDYGKGFAVNLVFAQCIGLSICGSVLFGHLFIKNATPFRHFFMILTTMILGAVFGSVLGVFLVGFPLATVFEGRPALLFQLVCIGILFGTIITYFFFSQERISQARTQMQEERLKRLESEKREVETRLRLLQAQIEPHFLFNSLSTVVSLVETEPEKASHMLTHLVQYLRGSLSKTRAEQTTLGQEMDMARDYLDIYKIRMGDRLRYHIQIEDGLREKPLAPMLVQPLVENAVRHGLEPSVAGGNISLSAQKEGGRIRITVADSGQGLEETSHPGFGLANIRDRLHALYGKEARLILEENQPQGLKAMIEIPHG